MNEKEDAITGLVLLKKKLQAEMQYRTASPSMRLLNEIMSLMPPTAEADEAEQDQVTHLLDLPAHSMSTSKIGMKWSKKDSQSVSGAGD